MDDTGDLPNLLRSADVERVFGVCPRTIRRWVKAGLLPVVQVGRSRFFAASDVRLTLSNRLMGAILAPYRTHRATRSSTSITANLTE